MKSLNKKFKIIELMLALFIIIVTGGGGLYIALKYGEISSISDFAGLMLSIVVYIIFSIGLVISAVFGMNSIISKIKKI